MNCPLAKAGLGSNHRMENMTTENPVRVVLADHHAVVRKDIREFLEEAPGTCTGASITVVAEASKS